MGEGGRGEEARETKEETRERGKERKRKDHFLEETDGMKRLSLEGGQERREGGEVRFPRHHA